MSVPELFEDIIKEMRQCGNYAIYRKPIFSEPGAVSELYVKKFFYGQWLLDYGTIKVERPKIQEVGALELADRLESAYKRLRAAHKREMDEAATFINKYLEDSALDPRAHNWLIRNGYQDASYQADIFGQEIVKEGDST